MADSRGEVTMLLGELKLGRKDALERLMPLVYRELRRAAGRHMRDERPGHTLQATALVHEAFLRLVDQDHADWQNRVEGSFRRVRFAPAFRTEPLLMSLRQNSMLASVLTQFCICYLKTM